ncbi:MAG: RNA 2',3'-cyclic phosphodiesterase, partial [Pseudomonadota bacterium]
ADDMHITVLFMGEQGAELVEELDEALIAARFALPDLRIVDLGHFGRGAPRVAWAGVAPERPLEALHKQVSGHARKYGMRFERQRYVPHVTLARYTAGSVGADAFATAFARIGRLSLDPFRPHAMQLIESRLGPKGPRYRVLSEYPISTAS